MLHHLGAALRVVGVLVTSLALASFTVEVHSAAPASEWLRWFCVVGATIAAAVVVGCCFSKHDDDHAHHSGPRFRH
jgi:hypothetical protein